MRATIGNMRHLKTESPELFEAGAQGGFVAYSNETEEHCSANPSDYFMHDDDYCLKDARGYDMTIARKYVRTIIEVLQED